MKMFLGNVAMVSMIFTTAHAQDLAAHQDKHPGYVLQYQKLQPPQIKTLNAWMANGIQQTEKFFNNHFAHTFNVRIHPNRHSLDSTWSEDWKSPGLKTECWQVASGVASKVDILDPATWKIEACDHDPSDEKATAQLLHHELVHVYHGQHNPSPDFAEVEGLDWFVEGLATYASGQLDETRLKSVRENVIAGQYPKSLDDFWKGNDRYGLSGSMVAYIDGLNGRKMIVALLPMTRKQALLEKLGTTETQLINAWAEWVQGSKQPSGK